MQNTPHPDDELLSAFAGADRDAAADGGLAGHVATCDRCRGIVDELALLRAALSELPDLTPSRPLQLLPPVPEAARRGAGGWLRRLVAPVVAAGAGLLLVGAVGSAGLLGQGGIFGLAGAAPNRETSATDSAYAPPAGPDAAQSAAVAGSPGELAPGDTDGKSTDGEFSGSGAPPSPPGPWTLLLIAGAGLLLGGLVLRRSVQPGAG